MKSSSSVSDVKLSGSYISYPRVLSNAFYIYVTLERYCSYEDAVPFFLKLPQSDEADPNPKKFPRERRKMGGN